MRVSSNALRLEQTNNETITRIIHQTFCLFHEKSKFYAPTPILFPKLNKNDIFGFKCILFRLYQFRQSLRIFYQIESKILNSTSSLKNVGNLGVVFHIEIFINFTGIRSFLFRLERKRYFFLSKSLLEANQQQTRNHTRFRSVVVITFA